MIKKYFNCCFLNEIKNCRLNLYICVFFLKKIKNSKYMIKLINIILNFFVGIICKCFSIIKAEFSI